MSLTIQQGVEKYKELRLSGMTLVQANWDLCATYGMTPDESAAARKIAEGQEPHDPRAGRVYGAEKQFRDSGNSESDEDRSFGL